jgi:hypothetical protein
MTMTKRIEPAGGWAAARSVWLVTKAGVFQQARMALVRAPADLLPFMPQDKPATATENGIQMWAALTPEQAADPSWDAVPTSWPKRLPDGMARGVGSVVMLPNGSRAWQGGGLRYHLSDKGRPHQKPGQTPLAPGAEIVDEAALLAHADALGQDLELVERGTGRAVKVQRANERRVARV